MLITITIVLILLAIMVHEGGHAVAMHYKGVSFFLGHFF